jgi:hypothetical protein
MNPEEKPKRKQNPPPPPPPPGNNWGTKLKDPKIRQKAYREYCEWIASGMPKQSFFYDDGEHSVTWQTLDKYIEDNPAEFNPLLMQKARASRFTHWFGEGKKLMSGKYKGGSPVVWQTIMRNIFKDPDIAWDREQIQESNKAHVERLAGSIRESVAEAEAGDSEEQL